MSCRGDLCFHDLLGWDCCCSLYRAAQVRDQLYATVSWVVVIQKATVGLALKIKPVVRAHVVLSAKKTRAAKRVGARQMTCATTVLGVVSMGIA